LSKITIALEAAVAAVIASTPKDGPQTSRQRVNVDRAFAAILKLIAPRFRHFIRQYGLTAHWEDAEQCCAIAVHRAIQAYDPDKAQFTTFVNWQIRGELQSLRFRLMTDQRPSAKKVEATTISLSALAVGNDGDDTAPELVIEDEDALARTEAGASEYLAEGAITSLIDAYVGHLRTLGLAELRRRPRPKREEAARRRESGRLNVATHGIDPGEIDKLEAKLARDREIVSRRVFQTATLEDLSTEADITKERVRQITKRAAKAIAEIASSDPRFSLMADYVATRRQATPVVVHATAGTSILADANAPHNRLSSVRSIDPASLGAETAAEMAKVEALALAGEAPIPAHIALH
jgi:RNA polymerase sigma-32 factor